MLTFMMGGLAGWNIYLLFKNQTALENYDIDVASRATQRYRPGTPANKPKVLRARARAACYGCAREGVRECV